MPTSLIRAPRVFRPCDSPDTLRCLMISGKGGLIFFLIYMKNSVKERNFSVYYSKKKQIGGYILLLST